MLLETLLGAVGEAGIGGGDLGVGRTDVFLVLGQSNIVGSGDVIYTVILYQYVKLCLDRSLTLEHLGGFSNLGPRFGRCFGAKHVHTRRRVLVGSLLARLDCPFTLYEVYCAFTDTLILY